MEEINLYGDCPHGMRNEFQAGYMKLAVARRFLSLLYTHPHNEEEMLGSPNIYGNKYGETSPRRVYKSGQ